ncbi:MAG: hypothetical protein ABIE84_02310 [bacterium]
MSVRTALTRRLPVTGKWTRPTFAVPIINRAREMGVTQNDPTFGFIGGGQPLNARFLNEQLNKAWEEKEDKSANELEYNGVIFFRRKSGSRHIWATDKENVEAVAKILQQGYFPFEISPLADHEMGVTQNDPIFGFIGGRQQNNANFLKKLLNKAWEEKADKSTNELEYNGVIFFRRKAGPRPIWATDKKNVEAVAKILQQGYFPFEISPLADHEMGVTVNDPTFGFIGGRQQNNSKSLNEQLNKAWEEKEDKSANELEYNGVIFFRRKSGSNYIWATDKENFLAVANILGEINEC